MSFQDEEKGVRKSDLRVKISSSSGLSGEIALSILLAFATLNGSL